MLISEILTPNHIILELKSPNKLRVFEELTDFFVKIEPDLPRKTILDGLWERENKMTTGIARNIALPHTHVPGLTQTMGILGVSRRGIDYGSLDGKPVHIIMMLLGNEDDPNGHIMVLKNLALLITNPDFIPRILDCDTPQKVFQAIEDFENKAQMFFS